MAVYTITSTYAQVATRPLHPLPGHPIIERMAARRLVSDKQRLISEITASSDPRSIFDAIRKRLLIERTAIRNADAIIVFGNRHIAEKLATQAAELFFEGHAPYIVVSGGRADDNGGISEAEAIKRALLKLKRPVPEGAILMDEASSNSKENIQNSIELIQGINEGRRPKRIITVGTVLAGRRLLMASLENFPDITPMARNVNPFETPLDQWFEDETFREIVLNEYCKLDAYIDFGWLKEINLHDLNQRILQPQHATPNLRVSRSCP